MKRLFLIPLIIIVVFALIFGGCAKPAPAPAPTPAPTPTPTPTPTPVEPIKLKFAYSMPPMTVPARYMFKPWAEMIEERTANIGKPVEITFFPSGALAKIPEQYDIIPKGVTDIGLWAPTMMVGRFPANEVMDLPILFSSAIVASRVIQELFETYPAIRDEYAEAKVLWFLPSPEAHLSARTKQIKTLKDLKGMKANAARRADVDVLEALKAVPVMIQMMEIYIALERGLLDVAVKNWEAVYVLKWFEVTKYRTALPVGLNVSHLVISMNWDSWNSLPPDVQEIFEELSGSYMSKFSGEVFDRETAKRLELIKEHDKKVGNPGIYNLPKDEFQRWVEAVTPVYEKWITDTEAKGIPGRAIFEDTHRLIEKYSK